MQYRSRPSGGELLAAASAPRRDDLAAAHRAHARPKTMPALADELARLIGAFQGTNSKLTAANLKIGSRGPAQPFGRPVREKNRCADGTAGLCKTHRGKSTLWPNPCSNPCHMTSGRKRPDSEKVFNVMRMFRWALSSPRTRAFLRATASCRVALMRRLQSAPSCEVRDNLPIEPDCHQLLRRLFLPSPPPAFPQIIHHLSPSNYPTALKRRPLLRLGFVSSK
jgi:hypothetical protein